MSRVQLAINVTDVGKAVDFYTRLFGEGPAKVRPGYANFAIADPPLKLVLIEATQGGTLNHLGVEVSSREEVAQAQGRLSAQGMATVAEQGACCYAEQDKVWVTDPDGSSWEVYTVLGDSPVMASKTQALAGACGPGCC